MVGSSQPAEHPVRYRPERLGVQDIIDAKQRPQHRISSPKATSRLHKTVAAALGEPPVSVRHGSIVEIARYDARESAMLDVADYRIDLFGAQAQR